MLNPQSRNDFNLLSKFASLLVFLAASLYFTGYIYRLSYYHFWGIELSTLNFPTESFYVVAFNLVLDNIAKTLIAFLIITLAIFVTFGIIQIIIIQGGYFIFSFIIKQLKKIPLKSRIKEKLKLIQERLKLIQVLNSNQRDSLLLIASLIDEVVIIAWILAALFYLAYNQGYDNALKDAVNSSSQLPIVTIVYGKNSLPIGRNLDDIDSGVNSRKFSILGDKDLYNKIVSHEVTKTDSTEVPVVWRLLLYQNGYFYIFPALPDKYKDSKRSPIVMLNANNNPNQVLILKRP